MYITITHEQVPKTVLLRGGGSVQYMVVQSKVTCDWALYHKESME